MGGGEGRRGGKAAGIAESREGGHETRSPLEGKILAPRPDTAGGNASRAPAGPVEGQIGVTKPSQGLPVSQVGGCVCDRPLSPVILTP
jgi:hypothetical protein